MREDDAEHPSAGLMLPTWRDYARSVRNTSHERPAMRTPLVAMTADSDPGCLDQHSNRPASGGAVSGDKSTAGLPPLAKVRTTIADPPTR